MEAVERPSRQEFEAGAVRLRGVAAHTPLVPLQAPGHEGVLLKLEVLQPVGCFKVRGIFHAVDVMGAEARSRGLSTVSAGNTAKALAWAGRRFGVPARSLMPDTAPPEKVRAVEAFGGEAVLIPRAEVFRFLEERGWEDEDFAFVHPWTDRDVLVGHGSLGLELAEDCAELSTVYVPVGGGGLLGGVGSALRAVRPDVRIVAVEPRGCPALAASLEAGEPRRVDCSTICDGVAVPYVTAQMFPLLRDLVDDCVLVDDEDVRAAVRLLAVKNHVVAEPSGALAVAAALAASGPHPAGTVCLVTGGSIGPERLAEILCSA